MVSGCTGFPRFCSPIFSRATLKFYLSECRFCVGLPIVSTQSPTRNQIMRRKYCLVRNPEAFSPETVVFCLWVGTSSREQTYLALVESYCMDLGWFLRPWDEDTNFWLISKCKPIRPSSKFPQLWQRMAQMSMRSFYKILMEQNLDQYESTLKYPPRFITTISTIDEAFFWSLRSEIQNGIKKASSSRSAERALSVARKYLSNAEDREKLFGVVGFGLLLLVLYVYSILIQFFNLEEYVQ